jgi:4-amino-4-deoxy-L-arabinose transferase-like glycosyltransferase
MWYAGDLNPHYYVYPSLYYDLQALLAFVVGHVAGVFEPDVLRHPLFHQPLFYLAGRALTAVLGTLTVLVVYLVGRTLNTRVGLIAGLFLAVTAQHVQQSHYITVDAPTALFTALAALFALRALRDGGERRDVILGGIAAGLAAGTKYNAGVAVVLPIAAVLLTSRGWSWRLRMSLLAVLTTAVTFLVTTPYALLDRGGPGRPWPFLNSLQVVARHYADGHPGAEGNDNALWYIQYLAHDGMVGLLTALALAGLVVALVRFRRAGIVLIAFTVPYYALLCATFVRFDRNLLPLLPFLAVLAAVAADTLIPPLAVLLRNRAAAYIAVLGLACVPSASVAAQADFAISHPFTEQVAVAWADAHLPRHATVAIENWEGRSFELSPQAYRITALNSLAVEPYDWYLAHGIRYVVADSFTDDAYLSAPRRYALQVARYRELYRRARLLARITSQSLTRPGPTMSIYELR